MRKFFCVNLVSRPDRRKNAIAQFCILGIEGVVFPEFHLHPKGGRIGCRDSHMSVWRHPSIKDNDTVIVFEDDLQFCGDSVEDFWDTLREAEELLDNGVCEIANLTGMLLAAKYKVSKRFWKGSKTSNLAYISKGRILKNMARRAIGTDVHVDIITSVSSNMAIIDKNIFTSDPFDSDNKWANNDKLDRMLRRYYVMYADKPVSSKRNLLEKVLSKIMLGAMVYHYVLKPPSDTIVVTTRDM